MRGVFVTATDTGVGKTVLAGAICAVLRARGERVAAYKPVVTGTAEPEPGVPPDHVLLATCTGQRPEQVTARTFGPAVSPHLAAAEAPLDPAALEAAASAAAPPDGVLVVEGIGGLLVPLDGHGYDIRALARALGLPVVIAARPGLGTINHTLLTIEAAWSAGLDVRGVVLTPWPDAPSAAERSNAATIASLGDVTVSHLPRVTALTPAALAAAGAELPVQRWLGVAAPNPAAL
jgi:dethiobiotin synthetase